MTAQKSYPLVIVGAGPAGMTASIYSSRYRVKHLILSPSVGGNMMESHKIENWPGEKEITGEDLSNKMWAHVQNYSPEVLQDEARKIEKIESGFLITTGLGELIEAQTIIFAGGTKPRRLMINGEEEFFGKGVSYCATCDGFFFRDKVVAVVGGANSATMASLELAEHAKKVYIIYRAPDLKGEALWIERVMQNPKIERIALTNVIKISGNNKVEKIELDNEYNGKKEIELDGVFIEIGTVPFADLMQPIGVELDNLGFIKIDSQGSSSVAGLFAAGDTTNGSGGFRQIATAVGEGAVAARGVFEYLRGKQSLIK